jgi:uncharacterized membrane-anchored protein YhcB (DUF1043 family)
MVSGGLRYMIYILLITIIILDSIILFDLLNRNKKDSLVSKDINSVKDDLDKFREEYVNYTLSQTDLATLSDEELIKRKLEIEFNGGVELPYEYNR